MSALDVYRAPGSQLHYKRIEMIAEYAVNGAIEDFLPTNDNRFVVRDSYNTLIAVNMDPEIDETIKKKLMIFTQ